MRKVRTKREVNFILQAVFHQLKNKKFKELFNGGTVEIVFFGKPIRIKWERSTGIFSKEEL